VSTKSGEVQTPNDHGATTVNKTVREGGDADQVECKLPNVNGD